MQENLDAILVYDGAVLEKRQRHTKKPLNFPVARDEMTAAVVSYFLGLAVLAALTGVAKLVPAALPLLLTEMAPILLTAWLAPLPAFIAYEVWTAAIIGRPL